jgi:hypothetical protein
MAMSENWQRGVLIAAAAWNVVGGTAALMESPRDIAWIAVIAWGAAYLGAAFAPLSRRVVAMAGGAGKLAYFVATAALFGQGAVSGTLLATGALDLVFVALFAVIASEPVRNQTSARPLAA